MQGSLKVYQPLSYDFEKRRRGGGVNGDEINQPFGNKSSVEIVISAN